MIADPVQQSQFAPLSDSLCWAILEITSLGESMHVYVYSFFEDFGSFSFFMNRLKGSTIEIKSNCMILRIRGTMLNISIRNRFNLQIS